jgi:hypothetical protein
MTIADLKCEMLLEYFVTKEEYRAYRKRGGDLFGKPTTMDNYMDVLDIYELLNYCNDKQFIMEILHLTDRAYGTLLDKYIAYRAYKRK